MKMKMSERKRDPKRKKRKEKGLKWQMSRWSP